ncbi:MAG: hypothetical protein CMJ64_06375 [Planctomycetaceae bacterium]|nr:hypothetical protein [Planctomycetaceae bacterium]
MASDIQTDLARFHQFVGEQVADADVRLTPEQAVAIWRHQEEEMAAIEEGLVDVEAGRTIPLEEHLRHIRERFQLP